MSEGSLLPSRSRAERLPFDEISWERFEVFCFDLISRSSEFIPGSAHRYGGQGHKQRGIDVLADHHDESHWGFSNKRYKRYSVSHATKHISQTPYPADHYRMLISGIASPEVRDEVRRHTGWDVWDADDLSQRVRELASASPNEARRLVDDHFGTRWRAEFLGLLAVGAFHAPHDYFRRWREEGRLFHHRHPLVGRGGPLGELHAFVDSQQHRVAVLPGPGAIGKTRLLCAFADEFEQRYAEDKFIRFLAEGVPLSHEALDELPLGSCLIVVDDAHRYSDLGLLLEWVQQHLQGKVLLVSRPQGVDMLSSLLTRCGFDIRQVQVMDNLGSLAWEDQCALARAALGTENDDLIERLARATRDCPLATVVGGQLLREKSVAPELLERDEEFQRVLLDRFRDELLGKISDRVPAELCNRALRLYAAVAPIPTQGTSFYNRASEFLAVETQELIGVTAELERCGILVRRGRQLRISPDLLADHILHTSCLTAQKAATGFALDVFRRFQNICPSQVLRNLAELDWRVRITTGSEPPLLFELWQQIEDDFAASSHGPRVAWLKLLHEVAYFQPGRIIELVRRAIRQPAPEDEHCVFPGLPGLSHQDVLRLVPPLLQRAAFTLAYCPTCLDLLWELGRDDVRATNPVPEHPMRVLAEIAGYQPGKPLEFQRLIIQAVRRWLRDPGAHTHDHSPLELLSPLLAKSGTVHIGTGRGFSIQSFSVRADAVAEIRSQAVDILQQCLSVPNLAVILRAVTVLGESLHGPMPYFGAEYGDAELSQWEGEQLKILKIFRELLASGAHPLVRLRILREVRYHARHDNSGQVRREAAEVLRLVGADYDLDLTRLLVPLMSDWDLFDEIDDDSGGGNPTDRRQRNLQQLRQRVVPEFWRRHTTGESALQELEQRLGELLPCEPEASARNLLWSLLEDCPDEIETVAQAILDSPDRPTNGCFGVCLSLLRQRDAPASSEWARRALNTGHQVICRAVSHHYCWQRNEVRASAPEIGIIQSLLVHPDKHVQADGAGALRNVLRHDHRAAIDMAHAVEVGDNEALATELCRLADPDWSGRPDEFTDDDYRAFLRKLDHVSKLNYDVVRFMIQAVARVPDEVVALLLRRIASAGETGEDRYYAIPFDGMGQVFEPIVKHPLRRTLLERVRDASLPMDALRRHHLGRLYRSLSLNHDDEGVTVLQEWIDSGDRKRIEGAAYLLREAAHNFVFVRTGFVVHALECAEQFGQDCFDYVSHCLSSSAIYGTRTGTAGEPFPRDISMRVSARSVMNDLAPGTPAYQFYEKILRSAEGNIEESKMEAEEMED